MVQTPKKYFISTNNFLFLAVIVAEVTQPSLGVGYEIGRAFDMNKPILCLYRPQQGKCKFEKNMFFINKRILETALFHENKDLSILPN